MIIKAKNKLCKDHKLFDKYEIAPLVFISLKIFIICQIGNKKAKVSMLFCSLCNHLKIVFFIKTNSYGFCLPALDQFIFTIPYFGVVRKEPQCRQSYD